MSYKLRLESDRVYLLDLQTIINSVKINGNKATCDSVIVSHPKGAEILLHMNFGLEQNVKNPPAVASLNILGFKTQNGQEFIFKDVPFSCDKIEKNAQKLAINGSYKSLGYAMSLPLITDANLFESIVLLNKIGNADEIGQQEYDALARLIIILSGAIRFATVANGINNILGNSNTFSPNLFELIGWGGHSIAS